jgi:hypothetical protein
MPIKANNKEFDDKIYNKNKNNNIDDMPIKSNK